MSDKPNLTLVSQAKGYFHDLLTRALGQQKISTRPETEFYLVNLLNEFISTDKLYSRDGQGAMKDEPLALLLKEALEAPELRAQSVMFRHVGDVSLYVAGFFQESLSRKVVDVDYYIGLGGVAYQNVAAREQQDVLRAVYMELAEKFSSFVDVLAEISDLTASKSEKDLLRLYDLWVRTRSGRAAKALQEAGIFPNPTLKKDWQ